MILNSVGFIEQNLKRIKAIARLLGACQLALTGIDRWNEVAVGSEDSRTDEAIKALEGAIAMAR